MLPPSMHFTRRHCAQAEMTNGAPGLRPIYGPDYYASFIIDPDGYRIEAYYGPVET
jgi:hypothetical protein